MTNSWRVPCDKCHKHWVTTECETSTVLDKLSFQGVEASFQRKVLRYENVVCEECKGRKGKPSI